MKVLIAIDSFKGSLSSLELSRAINLGIKNIYSECEVKKIPIADGGEGTIELLIEGTGGKIIKGEVKNPLGEKIK